MKTREDFIKLTGITGIEVIWFDSLLMEAERRGAVKAAEQAKRDMELAIQNTKMGGRHVSNPN